MPVAALFDSGGDHTAIMRSIFERAAPEGWTVQHYDVSGLGALPIAQAIADGASLIINPNPVGLPTVWDAALAAGVPVVSAHASNEPIFVSAGYVGWPVVVSAAQSDDTDPRTSYGPGVELTIRPAQTVTQSWATASAAAALATLLDRYGNAFDARSALRSLAVSSHDWQCVGLVDLRNVPPDEGAEILSADLRAGVGWFTYEDSDFQVEPSEILPGGFRIFGNASSVDVPLLGGAEPPPPASGSALRLRATMHVASATPALLRLHGWQVTQTVTPGTTDEVDLLGGYLTGSNSPQVQVRGTVPGGFVDVHLSGLSQEAYEYTPTALPESVAPAHPPIHVRADGGVLRFLPWQGSRYYRTAVSVTRGDTVTSHYVYPLPDDVEASVDLAAAFGFDNLTFEVSTQYIDYTESEPVTLSVDTGVPPVVHPVAAERGGGSPVVVSTTPTIGCNAQFRYRTVEGGEWTVSPLGDDLTLTTRRAAEVQAQQVDPRSGRASGWSSPILVPGLPSAEATAYLP